MSATIAAVERALTEGADGDEALRLAVAALAAEPQIVWAGIAFLDDGALMLGPAAGVPDLARRTTVPIAYQGTQVGELWTDGEPDRAVLEGIAALVAPQVLIGWDTGGEAWEP